MAKKPSNARAAPAKTGGQFVTPQLVHQPHKAVMAGTMVSAPPEALPRAKKPANQPRKASVPALKRSVAIGKTEAPPRGFMFDVESLMQSVQQHVHLSLQTRRNLRAEFQAVLERSTHVGERPHQVATGVVPEGDEVLSTQQAADLVGVSRPFMAARIDAGEVPLFQQVGNQRRVLASSVRAWHEQTRLKRRKALVQLGQSIDDEYPDEG